MTIDVVNAIPVVQTLHGFECVQDTGENAPWYAWFKYIDSDVERVPVYYVNGKRNYYGVSKLHRSLDCPALRRWVPGKLEGVNLDYRRVFKRYWMPVSEAEHFDKRWCCELCWQKESGDG